MIPFLLLAITDVTCIDNDCRHKGWTTGTQNRVTETHCMKEDCFNTGHILDDHHGYKIITTCRTPGCFVSGWNNVYSVNGWKDSATCRDGDCLHNGYLIERNDGLIISIICIANDCEHIGSEITIQGHRIYSYCKKDDCFTNGWTSD